MSEKILSIKLAVDATEGAKLTKVTKEYEEALKQSSGTIATLAALEKERAGIVEKQKIAYERLTSTIANANSLLEKGGSQSNLAFYNANKAAEKYNSTLKETQLALALVASSSAKINAFSIQQATRNNSISAGTYGSSASAVPEAAGVANARQEELTRARLSREQELIRNFNSATERIEAEAAARRTFTTQAETNSRRVMYAGMFDQIEARERQATAIAAEQARTRQSFAERINSVPRVGSQGSQADITGRLTSYLQQEASARETATRTIQQNTTAHGDNISRVEATIVAHRNLFTHIGEIIGIYRLYNFTLNTVSQALRAIPSAGLEQQTTQSSLLGIFGTTKGEENIAFIHKIADEAGQSLLTLEQAYRRYAPSAILAGAKQKEVNQSFKDFAEVGTILHLPEEKINSLFLALDQMFAKGVVQSEEVKKQLGNVLPGAVEAFAISMGKTPAAFMEAMKKNEVIAKEAVPKFAAYYRKIFGGPDDSVFTLVKDRLQSNLNRLENTYTDFNRAVFAKNQDTLNDVVKGIIRIGETTIANLTGIGQAVEILSELIALRLAGALLAASVGVGSLLTKLNSAVLLLTGLSTSSVAAGAGVIYLYGKVNDLAITYDKANGFLVTFQNKQVSLTTYIKQFAIAAFEDWAIAINKVKDAFDIHPLDAWSKKLDEIVHKWHIVVAAFTAIGNTQGGSNKTGNFSSVIEDYKKTLVELDKVQVEAAKKPAKGTPLFGFQDNAKVFNKALLDDYTSFITDLNGKSSAEIEKSILAGKVKKDDILKVRQASINIPPTDISGNIESELVASINSKQLSAAITKENDLLKQRVVNITNNTTLAKLALENSLKNLDFGQANIQTGKALPRDEANAKRISIEKELIALELRKNAAIKEQTVISKNNLEFLEKQYSQTVANTDETIRAIRLQESGSRDRTSKSDRAVSSTGAVGAMQIFKAAWIDTGKEEADFTKASYEELDKTGQDYFRQQLERFKDLKVALAAYKEGPTKVAAIYTKVKVRVGDIDESEISKVYAAFTPAMEKYSREVISKLPANKVSNDLIAKQTEISTLNQEALQVQLSGEQKLTEEKNKQIVSLIEYKKYLAEIKANALAAQGDIAGSREIQINLKYLSDELILRKNVNLEEAKLLSITKQHEKVMGNIADIELKLSKIEADRGRQSATYNDSLNKINILKNIGALSDYNAAIKATQVNRENIKVLEESLRLEQAATEAAKANAGTDPLANKALVGMQSTFLQHKRELENLRLEVDVTAQFIQTRFAAAFDNAFVGFVTGTMTAKQAFKSFADSVIQDIAKIIAQELRLQLIKGIVSGIGTLAGAFAGSSSSSNSSSFTNAVGKNGSLSSNFVWGAADGTVATGLSSASGTILSAATYFPMAKPVPYASGGIVAGEAGQEAVIPLKNGKINVNLLNKDKSNLTNSGISGIIIQNLAVTVQEKEGTTSQDQAKLIGETIKVQLKSIVQHELTQATRPGNTLNPTQMAVNF